MLILLAYFALGAIADILIARYYLALSARRALQASVLAVVIPLITFLVIDKSLEQQSIMPFFVFTLGNGLGTFLAVRNDRRSS